MGDVDRQLCAQNVTSALIPPSLRHGFHNNCGRKNPLPEPSSEIKTMDINNLGWIIPVAVGGLMFVIFALVFGGCFYAGESNSEFCKPVWPPRRPLCACGIPEHESTTIRASVCCCKFNRQRARRFRRR